ncbi:transposase [Streptomyces hirsutus]|uniref:transposase n=1 Tax=Streptomyces hirsutus TaxID=35620 RepID=UPI0033CD225A
MSTSMDHLVGDAEGVEGADVQSMPMSVNGASAELLEELAALAAVKTAQGGLKLMGVGGILPELAQHLMQAALEAEMDLHLAAEAGRVGGRGSRSGGNSRNGYRAKKAMTEVGAVTVQVPPDRLGTFRPSLVPKYGRRNGALEGSLSRAVRAASSSWSACCARYAAYVSEAAVSRRARAAAAAWRWTIRP